MEIQLEINLKIGSIGSQDSNGRTSVGTDGKASMSIRAGRGATTVIATLYGTNQSVSFQLEGTGTFQLENFKLKKLSRNSDFLKAQ